MEFESQGQTVAILNPLPAIIEQLVNILQHLLCDAYYQAPKWTNYLLKDEKLAVDYLQLISTVVWKQKTTYAGNSKTFTTAIKTTISTSKKKKFIIITSRMWGQDLIFSMCGKVTRLRPKLAHNVHAICANKAFMPQLEAVMEQKPCPGPSQPLFNPGARENSKIVTLTSVNNR